MGWRLIFRPSRNRWKPRSCGSVPNRRQLTRTPSSVGTASSPRSRRSACRAGVASPVVAEPAGAADRSAPAGSSSAAALPADTTRALPATSASSDLRARVIALGPFPDQGQVVTVSGGPWVLLGSASRSRRRHGFGEPSWSGSAEKPLPDLVIADRGAGDRVGRAPFDRCCRRSGPPRVRGDLGTGCWPLPVRPSGTLAGVIEGLVECGRRGAAVDRSVHADPVVVPTGAAPRVGMSQPATRTGVRRVRLWWRRSGPG